jgi:hypothetical protein
MGAHFSSHQLSGAVENGLPSTSYAYAPGNTNYFGVDATYTWNGEGFYTSITPMGLITPYLIPPAATAVGATLTCSPFLVSSASQSLKCPIAGTAMATGLYTVSFSQLPTATRTASTTGTNGVLSSASTYLTTGTTLTNFQGAVTFSITNPPATIVPSTATVTITPTVTDTTTILSGISEILPSSTASVPSSVQTVTVYETTIVSTQTSLSTLTGASLLTVTASCPTSTTSTTTTTSKPTTTSTTSKIATTMMACNHDNCLRGLLGKSAAATSFCATYTKTPNLPTPTYASQCSGLPSRVSSACSCLVQPTTTSATVTARGVSLIIYGPPDYTYGPGLGSTVTSTSTVGPLTTVTSGPIPTATM